MALVLSVPPGIVSHLPGVELVAQRPVTADLRRAIVMRFQQQRSSFPSAKACARVVSAQLAAQGIQYSATAIAMLLTRHKGQPTRAFLYERALAQFRQRNPRKGTAQARDAFWYDRGDFPYIRSQSSWNALIVRLRNLGHDIRKCPCSYEDRRERGWDFQYRLWEAGAP